MAAFPTTVFIAMGSKGVCMVEYVLMHLEATASTFELFPGRCRATIPASTCLLLLCTDGGVLRVEVQVPGLVESRSREGNQARR